MSNFRFTVMSSTDFSHIVYCLTSNKKENVIFKYQLPYSKYVLPDFLHLIVVRNSNNFEIMGCLFSTCKYFISASSRAVHRFYCENFCKFFDFSLPLVCSRTWGWWTIHMLVSIPRVWTKLLIAHGRLQMMSYKISQLLFLSAQFISRTPCHARSPTCSTLLQNKPSHGRLSSTILPLRYEPRRHLTMCASNAAEKTCKTCGRTMSWRKKWERCWDEVKYCSDKCRKSKPSTEDGGLEQAILDMLAGRKAGATICPSEIARACFPDEQWRSEMERVRQAARRLVAEGRIVITQKGQVVDPSTAKGPIRLRLR